MKEKTTSRYLLQVYVHILLIILVNVNNGVEIKIILELSEMPEIVRIHCTYYRL